MISAVPPVVPDPHIIPEVPDAITAVPAELHVPPASASVRVTQFVPHIKLTPFIAGGSGSMLTSQVVELVNPLPSVTVSV